MTQGLSEEIKKDIVKRVPLNFLGQVDDVAEGALYLASPGARYVTGQVLTIDGGMYM
jgi:3-oxoacyl-[acyl-carrier protein] reductase